MVSLLGRRLWLFLLFPYFTASSESSTIERFYLQSPTNTAVQGELGATLTVKSSIICSASCLLDAKCTSFIIKEQPVDNCVIIHPKISEGLTFTSDGQNFLYTEASVDCDEAWSPPSNWPAGDQPVVYRSFDTTDTDCMELENGGSLVTGQVGMAVSLDRSLNQTILFANMSGACILSPDTCSNGATLVLWVNVVDCPAQAGIMSSQSEEENGFRLVCGNNDIKYRLYLDNSKYEHYLGPKPSGWIHIAWVINDLGLGFSVYHNGALQETYTTPGNNTANPATGEVVIGKKWLNGDADFSSVIIDDLSLWNRKLTAQEISDIFSIL